jgi:hypothetical protein
VLRSTCKGGAKAPLLSTARADSAKPRISLWADACAPVGPTVSSQVERRFSLPCGDCRHRA